MKMAIFYFLLGCAFQFIAFMVSYQEMKFSMEDKIIEAKKETIAVYERLNRCLGGKLNESRQR